MGLGAALSVKTEFNGPKLVTRTDMRDWDWWSLKFTIDLKGNLLSC